MSARNRTPNENIQIVLLGERGVGQQNLMGRYLWDTYNPATDPTIGASFFCERVVVDGITSRVQVWCLSLPTLHTNKRTDRGEHLTDVIARTQALTGARATCLSLRGSVCQRDTASCWSLT